MADSISASALRADVDNVLDRVLATVEPVEIERQDRCLRLVPVVAESERAATRDLGALSPRRAGLVHSDAADLDQVDRSAGWGAGRAIDPA